MQYCAMHFRWFLGIAFIHSRLDCRLTSVSPCAQGPYKPPAPYHALQDWLPWQLYQSILYIVFMLSSNYSRCLGDPASSSAPSSPSGSISSVRCRQEMMTSSSSSFTIFHFQAMLTFSCNHSWGVFLSSSLLFMCLRLNYSHLLLYL